jgi:hypothetical protein
MIFGLNSLLVAADLLLEFHSDISLGCCKSAQIDRKVLAICQYWLAVKLSISKLVAPTWAHVSFAAQQIVKNEELQDEHQESRSK